MPGTHPLAALGVACGLVLSAAAASQDPPSDFRTIRSAGLSFDIPATWKQVAPSNQMRKAQIQIAPVDGDSEPAELVLSVFPGGAGGVEANVQRWQRQFADPNGSPPQVDSTKVKGQNVEITRVELSGTYTDPFSGSGPQKNYRLLGAIVPTADAAYFFKLVGPNQTVLSARPGFDAMLKSVRLE
ncbi:MAG: hypothetical protein KatS3mg108_3023 [Isosphaeraceae bacterium]|jgi:hypothetical protein|nr:MAG: hypothetical protein KatS3mg108_3023 [Isosphaeraceae bacterium]